MGGESGGEWIHVYVALSSFAIPETITTLLIGYTRIQNKKLKKKDEILNNYRLFLFSKLTNL